MTVAVSDTTGERVDERTTSRVISLALGGGAVLVTILIAAARLLVNPRFYFADDTQLGSIGIWRELGRMVLDGRFRILDPHAWQGGNYLAEGQWGLLNPLSWLIGLGSLVTDDVLLYVTLVKLAFLGAFALGIFMLARAYGASAWWAAAAGVIAPAAGFTVYMDAPSWVSGLFNVTAFTFSWWGLRRLELGRGPLPYLLSAYLLVTFGYVFGVLMLVVLLVLSLTVALVRRRWSWAIRVGLASTFGALLTITVYLPGILTAPVTDRGSNEIIQAWFLSADLTDLGGLASPTASMSIGAWWGPATHAPMAYVSWALPLVALVWPGLRGSVRRLLVPLLFTAGAAILILGPSHLGALRWPVRFFPYLAVALVIIWSVASTNGYPGAVTRRRLWITLGVTVTLSWLAWTQTPSADLILVTTIAILLAQASIYVIATVQHRLLTGRARSALAATMVAATTAAMLVPQLYEYRYTPLGTFAVPNDAAPMQQVLSEGVDDGLTIGDAYDGIFDPSTFEERLVANLWYYSPTSVSNVYTVLPFSRFAEDLCIDLRGATCPEAAETLVSRDATTGLTVSELLGVNTVLAIRSSFPDGAPDMGPSWTLKNAGSTTWTFVRDEPVDTAGGLAWTGEGTRATVLSQSDESVTVRIEELGTDPRLVFRRLAYPGYTVAGGSLAEPVRGYLLTVDASGSEAGDVLTVTFRPPGWAIEASAFVLAVTGLIAWPVWHLALSRRRSVRGVAGSSDKMGDRVRG